MIYRQGILDYYSFEEIDNTGVALSVCSTRGRGEWVPHPEETDWFTSGRERLTTANYDALAQEFSINKDRILRERQRHTANVMVAKSTDGGDGVIRQPIENIDGLVTAEPGLMICVVTADCVPVTFLDVKNRAAGIVHSGWKGTLSGIDRNAVLLMQKEFGSNPSDIIVCVGPHNCSECYEVGEDVHELFLNEYTSKYEKRLFTPPRKPMRITEDQNIVKYGLNLFEAISVQLENEGINRQNIHNSELCTYHTNKFYSYRRGENEHILSGVILK